MIENIRKYTGLMVVVLVLLFVGLVFLGDTAGNTFSGKPVMTVDGVGISQKEFQRLASNSLEIPSTLMGEAPLSQPARIAASRYLGDDILSNPSANAGIVLQTMTMYLQADDPRRFLANRIAVREAGLEYGATPGPEEVASFIRTILFTKPEGGFDSMAHDEYLSKKIGRLGIGSKGFNEYIRDLITAQNLAKILGGGIISETSSAEAIYNLDKQTITAEQVTLDMLDFEADLKPTEEEIKAFYEENKERYYSDELRKATYIFAEPDWNAELAKQETAEKLQKEAAERAKKEAEEAKKKAEAEKAKAAGEAKKKEADATDSVDKPTETSGAPDKPAENTEAPDKPAETTESPETPAETPETPAESTETTEAPVENDSPETPGEEGDEGQPGSQGEPAPETAEKGETPASPGESPAPEKEEAPKTEEAPVENEVKDTSAKEEADKPDSTEGTETGDKPKPGTTGKDDNPAPTPVKPVERAAKDKLSFQNKEAAVKGLTNQVDDLYQILLDNDGNDFEEHATNAGFTIKTTELFSLKNPPKDLDRTVSGGSIPKLADAIFSRPADGDPDEKMTDPYRTSEGWFIGRLDEVVPAEPLSYEEAKVRVTVDLKKKMARDKMVARAKELQEQLSAAVAEGKTFEEAAKAIDEKLVVSKVPNLSKPDLSGIPMQYRMQFAQPDPPAFQAAQYVNPGEVTEVKFTPSEDTPEKALIVFVNKREVTVDEAYTTGLNRQKEGQATLSRYLAFQNWLYEQYEKNQVNWLATEQ